MATTDYNFSATLTELITAAFEDCGVLGEGDTLSAAKIEYAKKRLNWMLSGWQTLGLGLWKQENTTLFLQPNQNKYLLGPSTTDHIAKTWYKTTLSADEASGQTILSITTNADMAATMVIGIELDNGSMHWSTISSSTSTTVTIANALTDTAESGNLVVFYATTSALDARPLRIMQASRYDLTTDIEVNFDLTRKADYFRIVQKKLPGTVTTAYYDKQLTNGEFYVWSTPSDCRTAVTLSYRHPIQDIETLSATLPLEPSFIRCVKLGLQKEICMTYGRDAELASIKEEAEAALQAFHEYDNEDGPIQIVPDYRTLY